jgi:hypothetical protein
MCRLVVAGVPLKDDRRGSAKAGKFAIFGDIERRRRTGKHCLL